jgi:5-methylcytosine-specific restriction endonuclease McrA
VTARQSTPRGQRNGALPRYGFMRSPHPGAVRSFGQASVAGQAPGIRYNPRMDPLVLTVDMAGLPQAWVALEEAITYHAKLMVAWSLGAVVREFRGGWQRDGSRSRIATKSILAIKGSAGRPLSHAPGLTNPMLFARDRQVCAYCGGRYLYRDLSRDHIIPASRGGRDTWMNSVTACRNCNTRKGNRAPEQANMPLLYVPYVPNRHEHFILRNRRILADQMEYLLTGVPRTSRLHPHSHVA